MSSPRTDSTSVLIKSEGTGLGVGDSLEGFRMHFEQLRLTTLSVKESTLEGRVFNAH